MSLINKYLTFAILVLYGSVAQGLEVPAGFKLEIFAENVANARQMALSDAGIVYVGSRREGKIYALVDADYDYKADRQVVIAEGLNMPSGVAYHDGDLYVGAVDKIWRFKDIDNTFDKNPKPELFFDGLPDESHHGWKYLKFGPDGKLYIPVGAPCNVCLEKDKRFASILRLDIETKKLESVATGVRNSVGFDWHPQTQELWFTDNGRDMLGDDIPACELNRASKLGEFFGFPFIHGKDVLDPTFGKELGDKAFTQPSWEFQAHVAPLGMMFYQGKQFPKQYHGSLFVTQHGSWNRSKKVGYKLVNLQLEGNKVISQQTFIGGGLDGQKALFRPNDVIMLDDGSLLVSDDAFDVIYRVSYQSDK